ERLVAGIYAAGDGPVGTMAETLELALWAEPLEKKIAKAVRAGELEVAPGGDAEARVRAATKVGLVSEEEGGRLARFYALVAAILAVDDFDPRELAADPLSPNENDRVARWRSEATGEERNKA
ncbi:MAG: acyl-CoA dehydrogenase domain-containing protein, partial [Gammaproteobacteria bacterium]